MSIGVVSMASPFRWLSKALDVGRRHPSALFGGFGLMLLVGMLPSVLQMAVQYSVEPDSSAMLAMYGAIMVLSAVILPPLIGGAFRLLHACEVGESPRAGDIFVFYRDPPMALRMIGAAWLILGLYVALIAVLWLLPGGAFFSELMKIAMTTAPGAQPDVSGLEAPPGLLLWMLLAVFAAVVLTNAYMLAFAQAALGDRSPVRAVGDGLVASIKNLLPFIGVFVAMVAFGFVAVLLLVLLVAVVFGGLALISPVLAMAVGVPVYLGLLLLVYIVMFGYYYHAWREIFGGAVVATAPTGVVL